MKYIKKTYGGYLPLELSKNAEWYFGKNVLSFNSFKAAITYLLNSRRIDTVYLPYYYCPSIVKALKNYKCLINYYHINNEFKPIDVRFTKNSIVVLVNYYGVNEINKDEYSDERIIYILDNAHSFFEKPIKKNNIYNIYSPKKFFGVPDGAYLIGSKINCNKEIIKPSFSYKYMSYLCSSYEKGTNFAYKQKKKVDEILDKNYAGMSFLSHGLLQNINYENILKIRKRNFGILSKKLDKYNELAFSKSFPAYAYPLLINKGKKIKKKLIKMGIYVPTLWKNEYSERMYNDFEKHITVDCIFLPIDQRYNDYDMHYIVKIVEELINGNT